METDPETGRAIFVEKNKYEKEKQKNILFRPLSRKPQKNTSRQNT
jgi:hypothetical protein